MQFEYTDPQTDIEKAFGGFFSINAFGQIEAGDETKFQQFLERSMPPPRTTIYIDSGGGEVEAAINIGRLIRGGWFSTSIGRYLLQHRHSSDLIISREFSPGRCMSAATLMFLGGRLRYFTEGARFGVHQFSFRDPSPDNLGRSQILSAKIAQYVVEMGISPDFLQLSSSVRSTDLVLVDEDRLNDLKVVTTGETDVSWTTHARNNMLYVRGERDSIFGHHKVMLCYAKDTGFVFWAVIEALGREAELTEFGLVEIVVNGEDKRIDISDRCARLVSGIYVNVFSKITHDEARLLAYSDSFGVQIRVGHEAEIFLGISAMVTDGGTEQLDTLFSILSEPT